MNIFKGNNYTKKDVYEFSLMMQSILGESPNESKNIARCWFDRQSKKRKTWSIVKSMSISESLSIAENISMPDETLLRDFMASYNEGLVLLTIHMGDYLHSLFKILSMTRNRKVVILRRKSESEEEQEIFSKLSVFGHEVLTVRHGSNAAKTLVKSLREGAIVILLYDLPSDWGRTESLNIFAKQFHWVVGPLQIALLGKSCVIPFYNYKKNNRSICDLKPVIDYRSVKGDKSFLIKKDLQHLATMAESNIRSHASQWDHWWLVPKMLIEGSGGNNA